MKSMVLKQYYLGCLAHASYLIADEASKTAIVVDPQRDIQQYLADASSLGVEIRHVFLTHFHADFIAGHLELRDCCDADIRLGSRAEAEYKFIPMKDGDTLELPGLRLQILETPGHTIESISVLVFDLQKYPARPYAVLTGDTLFVGDVGRPDLRASIGWSAQQLGGYLYDSLHNKLLTLPDDTLVYPTHGAGSLCGKNISSDIVSTIGAQRRFNYALQPMTKEEFIRLVTVDQPDAPAYFTYDAILNTRERPTLDAALKHNLHPLDLPQVLQLADSGTQLLDVRDDAEYAMGHLSNTINIGLSGQFATWAGTVLDSARPIVIIAEPGREQEAALRLGRIGFDNVTGYLKDGMRALASHPDLVCFTDRVSPSMLADELASPDPPVILDIRTPAEFASNHLAGGINLPLTQLRDRLTEIPRGHPIAVHCAGGYRSSIALSLLKQQGFTNLIELAGGITAWNAANLPIVQIVQSATVA